MADVVLENGATKAWVDLGSGEGQPIGPIEVVPGTVWFLTVHARGEPDGFGVSADEITVRAQISVAPYYVDYTLIHAEYHSPNPEGQNASLLLYYVVVDETFVGYSSVLHDPALGTSVGWQCQITVAHNVELTQIYRNLVFADSESGAISLTIPGAFASARNAGLAAFSSVGGTNQWIGADPDWASLTMLNASSVPVGRHGLLVERYHGTPPDLTVTGTGSDMATADLAGIAIEVVAANAGGGGGDISGSAGSGQTGLPKLEGEIYVPRGGLIFTITEDPFAVDTFTVPAGFYYLNTAHPTGKDPLLAVIIDLISATVILAGVYTAAIDDDYDASTGRVTFSATGVTSFAMFLPETLREPLGFESALSGFATYTSPNSAVVWLPDSHRGPSSLGPDQSDGTTVTDGRVIRSPSFKGRAVSRARGKVHSFQFPLIRGAKAWADFEDVPNESWESWWSAVIGAGRRFRYHPDRANDAVFTPTDAGWRSPAIDNMGLSPFVETADWTSSEMSLWMQGPIDAWKDGR